jgi:hypothetical protein
MNTNEHESDAVSEVRQVKLAFDRCMEVLPPTLVGKRSALEMVVGMMLSGQVVVVRRYGKVTDVSVLEGAQ